MYPYSFDMRDRGTRHLFTFAGWSWGLCYLLLALFFFLGFLGKWKLDEENTMAALVLLGVAIPMALNLIFYILYLVLSIFFPQRFG
jgi:hypothetical protein